VIFNVMITFVLSGLWHGAAWTYVAWGALNGLGILPALRTAKQPRLTPNEVPGGFGSIPSPGTAIRMAGTFLFSCVAWVFFRARSLSDAGVILNRIVTEPFVRHASKGFSTFITAPVSVLLIGVFLAVEWMCRSHVHPLRLERWPRLARWSVYTAMIWLAIYLRPLQIGKFIYFQF
jgi:alginate O-acetyltransferase complex protein AlgI